VKVSAPHPRKRGQIKRLDSQQFEGTGDARNLNTTMGDAISGRQ
jgi:hypothetical protein